MTRDTLTKEARAQFAAEQRDALREILADRPQLMILTDYSPSRMTRYTKVYAPIIRSDTGRAEILDITWRIAGAIGQRMQDRGDRSYLVGTGGGYSHATEICNALCFALGWEPGSIDYDGQI
jgi:hypothetical protein